MKKLFMILLCALLMIAVTSTVALAAEDTPETEESLTITEEVVNYVTGHAEQILAMAAAIASTIIVKLITGKLSSSVGTLNNNAITIAKDAGDKLSEATNELKEYKEKMTVLLEEFRKTEEDKLTLEDMMTKVLTFIETSKLATIELSTELSELLLLANIPVSKKEELYARHKDAIHKLEEAEGVINND